MQHAPSGSRVPASPPDVAGARVRPKKRFGQHFLVNRGVLHRIVETAELTSSDTVIEVGPGTGVLTAELAQRAGRVVAIEVDRAMMPGLGRLLVEYPNLSLVEGDVLRWEPRLLLQEAAPPEVGPHGYKVVANLPYNITAPVLRHFLAGQDPPSRFVAMVQYEVARALVAAPGEMSLLSVAVQFYGRVQLVTAVSPGSFSPPPKVRSAVVRIDTYAVPPVQAPSPERFFGTVRAGFSARRKQLRNALAQGLGVAPAEAAQTLEAAGVDPQRRAETLSLDEWARLSWAIQEAGSAA